MPAGAPSPGRSPRGRTTPGRTPTGRGAAGRGAASRSGRGLRATAAVRSPARPGPRRDPQRLYRRLRTVSSPSVPPAAARVARAGAAALGLSTARRAVVLAVVVCAVALTVAVPLRNYVAQRHEIAAVAVAQDRLAGEVGSLSHQRGALTDPAHVEALARERLGYARPGETPYRVELPGDAAVSGTGAALGAGDAAAAPQESDLPWYTRVGRETLGTGR